jgi:two-component system cell cycle response regulator
MIVTAIPNGYPVLKSLGKIIRQTIRNTDMPVRYGGEEINCTISVGITEMTGKTSDAEHLLRLADKALYHAKHGGRNRVVSILG